MKKKLIAIGFILGLNLFILGAGLPKHETVEDPISIFEPIPEEQIRQPVKRPVAVSETVVEEVEPVSLGEFTLTAYCSCERCCGEWANNRPDGIVYGSCGKELTSGYSIAVDPTVIPYGTVVIIDGHEYEAMDCGGAIKGNRIDVFFDSHDEALKFAVKNSEIFIKELD